jgi:hypothetical protein
MRICGLEFSKNTIQRIKQAVADVPVVTKRTIARRVCEWMDWRAVNGKLKETACRKALAVLEKQGAISLPTSGGTAHVGTVNNISKRISSIKPATVACELNELGPIEIKLVKSRYSKDAKVWKFLMDEHHYLGSGPLCGAQLRYIIHSPVHGYIGGMSFNSATWKIKDRDEFIGWTEGAHRANLQQVVCNSRFLIAPTVFVPNLASHVLGQCVIKIASDWKNSYGVEPVLLETFVDPKRFTGACYRAANWIHVGKTSGRRGSLREGQEGPKDIYLYPLQTKWKWQRILCAEPHIGLGERPRPDDPSDWVEEELGTVEFYDPRLSRRLFGLVRDFYGQSEASIPQACESLAKTTAAYRFFRNDRVTMNAILRAHTESTIERIKSHKVVLAAQDTTTLNYDNHSATQGLGPISSHKNPAMGLVVHDTMAFTPDGTPLGLLDVQCWSRDPQDIGKSQRRKKLPIEEKESIKWLKSYQAVADAQRLCPETRLISVGDRESDIYELFLEAKRDPAGPDLLVRCERSRNRKTDKDETGEHYLWDKMASLPVAGIHMVHIPRKGCQLARDAELEVRHARVTLKPPKDSGYQPIEVWMVYAKEINASRSTPKPLEWMLLTTVEVNDIEQACERLAWYAKRWGIEVFHRTLKSGCRIEDRRLETAESLEACLAIDMVIAWRIYHLTKLSREIPNSPCSTFFEEAEWKALCIYVNPGKLPKKEPTLREATRMVGSLGGFLGRKGDKEPGTTVLWRGLQRLSDITATYRALLPLLRSGP